jgi:hypothetical protein
VEISGQGRPVEPDPWGREEELGYASQTAIFRRIESPHVRAMDVPDLQTPPRHINLARHIHPAHPRAGNSLPPARIAAVVEHVMQSIGEEQMSVGELWRRRRVSLACGGCVEVFLCAVADNRGEGEKHERGEGHPGNTNLRLDVPRGEAGNGSTRWDWTVTLLSGVRKRHLQPRAPEELAEEDGYSLLSMAMDYNDAESLSAPDEGSGVKDCRYEDGRWPSQDNLQDNGWGVDNTAEANGWGTVGSDELGSWASTDDGWGAANTNWDEASHNQDSATGS